MIFSFWTREIAGWLLLLLGLYVFGLCIDGLLAAPPEWPKLLQSGPLTVIGFIVFRGGIHLLKVAAAARVCLQAQKEVYGQPGPAQPPRGRDGAKPPVAKAVGGG